MMVKCSFVEVRLKYKVLNYKNVAQIPFCFWKRIRSDKKLINYIKIISISAIIVDLLRVVFPSFYDHLNLKYPLVLMFYFLFLAMFIFFVGLYLFKYLFERNLFVSVSEKSFKVWRGRDLKRDVQFVNIQSIEHSPLDIFIHYKERNIQKILVLSCPAYELEQEVLIVKKNLFPGVN